MLHQHERQSVVDACLHMLSTGLVVGTAGNVSVRVGDHVVITPASTAYTSMTADDIAVVDTSGRQISGKRPPTSEMQLHLASYAARECEAVVHTHSKAAVVVSTLSEALPAVHYYLNGLGGSVRVAPYHTYGTKALAAAVTEALGAKSQAALMANHGATVLGATLAQALERAELLEWTCDVWLRAAAVGHPRLLSEEDLADARARGTRNIYEEVSQGPA